MNVKLPRFVGGVCLTSADYWLSVFELILSDGLWLFSRFVIGREKPGEQSEVAQLIQQTLEQERWQREMMEQRYKQYMDEDEEVYT